MELRGRTYRRKAESHMEVGSHPGEVELTGEKQREREPRGGWLAPWRGRTYRRKAERERATWRLARTLER